MDIKTTFLYGLINQLIYIDILKRLETEANQDMVCKLLKVFYDLKQSPHLRYKRLSNFLLHRLSLLQINVDYNIFVIKAGLHDPVVSTFVDNIKIMVLKENRMI